MTEVALREQRCEACTGATPLLTDAELERLRAQLHPDWQVEGDPRRLRRDIRTRDFITAFALATRVALYAESVGHHPDLNVSWGRLQVVIWTHKAKGLTRSDLVFAAHADAAAEGG